MKLRPNESLKKNYSPAEREIFDLLPANGKRFTASEVARIRYKNEMPYGAQGIVFQTLKSLSKKMAHNKEKIALKKSPRAGPREIKFWLEKTK
jgi:hypothetical protein